MKDVNINCWYCGAEQKELVEEISALTKENENLTNNYKNRLLDIQEFQNQIKALTEQVEKLKAENIKYFFNWDEHNKEVNALAVENERLKELMGVEHCPSIKDCYKASQELDRLREERKEYYDLVTDMRPMIGNRDFIQKDGRFYSLQARIQSLLDKFNDSKTI